MADTKISAMPTAATLDGTEIAPLVQTGDNVQQTVADIVGQTFQVTPNIGLNTTSPNSYGPGWTTLTIGGVNTNNPNPSGSEIDMVGADGSVTWLYQDGPNFNIEAQGSAAIQIYSSTQLTFNTALKTPQLTGFLYGNGSAGNVTASPYISGNVVDFKFGSFHQATTLTNTTPGTGIPMRFGTTDFSNGITIESDGTNLTYITPTTTGTYNFQFSAQLNKNGGGGAAIDVYIWLRINGVDVPATNTRVTLQGANVYTVAAWNFYSDANAGDHVQLMWASTSANAEITALTPAIGPTVPAAILTVNQISSF
jgi:hypothetical protein